MRRHVSVPRNLHSCMCHHNNLDSGKRMVGAILARDTPLSNPMSLHLDAGKDYLRIFLKQLTNGQVYSFLVAQIKYADLIIGWIWDDCNMFLLAQVIQDKTYDEIYCYPTDVSRNKWLKFFEYKQVPSMPFFFNRNSRHVPRGKITRYLIPPVMEFESGGSDESQACTNARKNIKNRKEQRFSME